MFNANTRVLLAALLASLAAQAVDLPAPDATAGTQKLDPAALARSRLYHPPGVPGATDPNIDNVYSMQIMALPDVGRMQAVGRKIFFDKSLSGSGRMACASCHDPAYAYGPPNALAVQPGGAAMDKLGNRAVPSLRYKERMPSFTEHYFDEEHPTGQDQGPTGGYGWDGHFSTLHIQAGLPLLAPNEMANASQSDVAAKLRKAAYAAEFRDTFGKDALDDDARAFKWLTLALEYFQRDPQEFFPYTSKYDASLRGQVALSEQEQRGLKWFNDKEKGNCASCHTSTPERPGTMPVFTDFGLIALGVPRNASLPTNKQHGFYDMGLCGPYRGDLAAHHEYCGAFRTPSLRNVALRHTFFHNGAFHDLHEVVEFYATRDTDPAHWYPRIHRGPNKGKVDMYDDLPVALRKNVNHDAPFSPYADGRPRLDKQEVDDIVAFLKTLTDGYVVPGKQTASAATH